MADEHGNDVSRCKVTASARVVLAPDDKPVEIVEMASKILEKGDGGIVEMASKILGKGEGVGIENDFKGENTATLLSELSTYSLIEWNQNRKSTFSTHRLVQQVQLDAMTR